MKKIIFPGVMILLLASIFAKPTQADPYLISTIPAWEQSIIKIKRAKSLGEITLDEAAILRLWAISDIERLPAEYQPDYFLDEFEDSSSKRRERIRGGLSELAERLDALFIDQELWSEKTRSFIMDSFEQASQASPDSDSDLPKEHMTPHFIIHWADKGPDAPSAGLSYIELIADSLENAWTTLESSAYGYEMPDPIEFGRSPHPDDDVARFDVYVGGDIKICNLVPIDRGGVALPGKIKLKNNIPLDELRTTAVHEWFHMVQWNYAGFRNSECPWGMLNAYIYYSNESAWLMESTARWIEDELYPDDNEYLDSIPDYMRLPEISLFERNGYHEYGAVVFIKFLQEHLAGPAGYSNDRDIVRDIWERVPIEENSTVNAVTYVLMHPPSGATPYAGFGDTWESIFDDFAIANLLKDYADGHLWVGGSDVDIVDTKKPIADPGYPVSGYQRGFGWPASQYIEVFPDDLNLPGGADSSGATIQLDFETSCPRCTLDILAFKASGGHIRTTYNFTEISDPMGSIFSVSEDISLDFGAPNGTEKLVLVFVSPVVDFRVEGYYKFTFSAIDNPPQPPSNLTASPNVDSLNIELGWEQVNESEIRYKIYRSTSSSVPTSPDHLLGTVQSTNYIDDDVERGVRYYYVVTSIDRGQNESDPSNQSSALIPTPTPTPPPGTTMVVIPISQGSDDAGPNPDQGCVYGTYWNEVYFGECFDGSDITSGFRFSNVAVPQGVTIQDAYLNFTVNGPYTNALSLRIRGEDTGDAGSFSGVRRPDTLLSTASSVPWVIPASDTWGLNNERQTPDISAIVQEIVTRSDWASGQGMAFIIENEGDAGGLHRRVIGYERPTSTYSGHLAELVITYVGQPVPTATPTPAVSPTPIPSPEDTPSPCTCAILCAMGSQSPNAQASNTGRKNHGLGVLASFIQQTAELWDGVELLQDIRDRMMVHSPEGRRYIDLYVENSPEIAALLIADSDLREEGFTTIDLFRPGIQALLEGRGNEVVITAEQILAVEEFLGHLSSAASPELAQIIADEKADKPLSQLIGKTMAEAQSVLLENGLPEADAGAGYQVIEGDQVELHGFATDPDNDLLSFEWDINDDGRYEKVGESVFFSAVGLDGPFIQTISLRVCDDKAGCVVERTSVHVLNAAPMVGAGEDLQADEGSEVTFEGIFFDLGVPDTHVVGWDFNGDAVSDVTYGALSNNPSIIHVWGDDYAGLVQLRVTDDDGLSGTDTTEVAIRNVDPIVSEILVTAPSHPSEAIWAGDLLAFSASFTDPGWLDTHSAQWQFGEGGGYKVAQLIEENEAPDATGEVRGENIYYKTGTYHITLMVSDDDGGAAEKSKEITIVPIPADVNCDPDVLSLRARGKWMTCYIELPSGYDVYEIDGSTVMLKGIEAYLGKQGWAKAEGIGANIDDYDKDGQLERMVKFEMEKVQEVLNEGQEVVLTIQGAVYHHDGLAEFEGEQTIRIIGENP